MKSKSLLREMGYTKKFIRNEQRLKQQDRYVQKNGVPVCVVLDCPLHGETWDIHFVKKAPLSIRVQCHCKIKTRKRGV
jgi:hypothetical protein